MGAFICRNIEDYTGVFDQSEKGKKMKKVSYQVFDNGKPADQKGFPILKGNGWKSSKFSTWQAAMAYARKWLGAYVVPLKINTPVDYSGYGDKIEVRRIT